MVWRGPVDGSPAIKTIFGLLREKEITPQSVNDNI